MFDRQIGGLRYGARTLASARIAFPVGRCAVELWGTNLGNARYVQFAASRPPAFYSGIPRPTDLVPSEGRRIGLTARIAG